MKLTFLGVGDASQQALGHASAAFEWPHGATLLIDAGPGVLDAFFARFQRLPDAVFITHCHLDHIADFEKLFIRSWFHQPQHRPKVFVPADIIPLLHQRVGTYPGALAEGGVNFWEAFQLIPVSERFEFEGEVFAVTPARHHGLNSAFSLALPGRCFYSGDTRPIPEVLEAWAGSKALLFHDCSLIGNPSHTGVEDLKREYSPALQAQLWLYHYHSAAEQATFEQHGFRCVQPGQSFELL